MANKCSECTYLRIDGYCDPDGDDFALKTFGNVNYYSPYYGDIKIFSLCQTQGGYSYSGDASDGECGVATFYYYHANYIRQTLTNSSYWRNNGEWYNNEHDEKSFVVTPSSLSGNKDTWKTIAGYNVFPISMSTRRNLYQYVYSFYNIGMYSDPDGGVGRIMGGAVDITGSPLNTSLGRVNHVIDDNAHACFYEVYESVCRCCGEPIVTETIVNYNGRVETSSYITQNNVPFVPSNPTTPGYEGQIGWYTNVVGLANLASSTQRVMGANWQASTPFILNGVYYSTNQGGELVREIEENADTVYEQRPEYSFTLTPSDLSEIRDYNDSNSYGIPGETALEVYGNVGFTKEAGQSWEVSNDEVDVRIRFAHYGSKYLEYVNTLGYTTEEYRGTMLLDYTGSNNVCLVEEGEVSSLYNGTFSGCRWIDYLTSDGIRLAFK